MDEYNDLNRTFSALADPTRRAILQQLMNGPARVTAIAAPHPISLNSVSKHLRILERAELVRRDVRGREHWFEFKKGPLSEARDCVDAMLNFWETRLGALEGLLLAGHEQENKDDR